MQVDVRVVRRGDEAPWRDEKRDLVIGQLGRAAVLQNGMTSGRSSIGLLIDLPPGSSRAEGLVIFAELSADMLDQIAAVTRGARDSWGESYDAGIVPISRDQGSPAP